MGGEDSWRTGGEEEKPEEGMEGWEGKEEGDEMGGGRLVRKSTPYIPGYLNTLTCCAIE